MSETYFTTGAFMRPMQLADGTWIWIITEFTDDTYKDGEVIFTMQERAKTRKQLTGVDDA
jgi:hypothetical protein